MSDDLIKDFYDNVKIDVSDEKICEIKENVLASLDKKKKVAKIRRFRPSVILTGIAIIILIPSAVSAVVQNSAPKVTEVNMDDLRKAMSEGLNEKQYNYYKDFYKAGIDIEFEQGYVTLSDEVMADLYEHSKVQPERVRHSITKYTLHFDTYDEVDSYLGLKLLKNTMMGPCQSTAKSDIQLYGVGFDNTITGVEIQSIHGIAGEETKNVVAMQTSIPLIDGMYTLKRMMTTDLGERYEASSIEHFSYISEKNNISAEIAYYTHKAQNSETENDIYRVSIYLKYDNVIYTIHGSTQKYSGTIEEYVEIYKKIVDGFEVPEQ